MMGEIDQGTSSATALGRNASSSSKCVRGIEGYSQLWTTSL